MKSSKYAIGAVSRLEMDALLGGLGGAESEGRIAWQAEGSAFGGTLHVRTSIARCERARVVMKVLTARPAAMTLAFIVNDAPVRRVCVNQKHDGWPPGSHSHQYDPNTGTEAATPLEDEFAFVPMTPTVAPDAHRRALEVFAGMVRVTLNEGYWHDPAASRGGFR